MAHEDTECPYDDDALRVSGALSFRASHIDAGLLTRGAAIDGFIIIVPIFYIGNIGIGNMVYNMIIIYIYVCMA